MHGIGVSTVTAFTAHKEWATRPPDERFSCIHALYAGSLSDVVGFAVNPLSMNAARARTPSRDPQ